MADQRVTDTEKMRQRLEHNLQEEAAFIQTEILQIQAQTVSCSSQKVLTSEMDEVSYGDEGQARGPFRNLFNT